MATEKNQTRDNQQNDQSINEQQKKPHSSPFKETSMHNEKSTTNVEEEVQMEQERKDAMRERD